MNNIAIISNQKQENENNKNVNNNHNIKHLANFSFGINNFNIITNNGKQNNANNHFNYDENILNNIIEIQDEYLSPKFNVPNSLNENKNIGNLNSKNKKKKIQFQISHIDSKDIININGKK